MSLKESFFTLRYPDLGTVSSGRLRDDFLEDAGRSGESNNASVSSLVREAVSSKSSSSTSKSSRSSSGDLLLLLAGDTFLTGEDFLRGETSSLLEELLVEGLLAFLLMSGTRVLSQLFPFDCLGPLSLAESSSHCGIGSGRAVARGVVVAVLAVVGLATVRGAGIGLATVLGAGTGLATVLEAGTGLVLVTVDGLTEDDGFALTDGFSVIGVFTLTG